MHQLRKNVVSLKIRPPRPELGGFRSFGTNDFRRVFAAALGDGPSLAHVRDTILHLEPPRGSESTTADPSFDMEKWNGKSTGRSPYIFTTRPDSGTITALGDEAVQTLLNSEGAIRDAFHHHWNERPFITIEQAYCSMVLHCGEPIAYGLPFVLRSRKHRVRSDADFQFWQARRGRPDYQFKSDDPEDRAMLRRIERRLLDSIVAQADLLGWQGEIPTGPDADGIRIFGLGATVMPPVAMRDCGYWSRVYLTFRSTSYFTGPWFLGCLTARGHGRLTIKAHPPRSLIRELEEDDALLVA